MSHMAPSAAETRIDVDQLRAALLGLHRPAEADRMGLGHVRAHDQDAVAVGQVLLIAGGRTAAERGAQTGHRCAMSYPGLIFDRDHAQSAAEELLDQIVLFIIQRRAAERADVVDGIEASALLRLVS